MHVFNNRLVALGFQLQSIFDFFFSPLLAFENTFRKSKCAAIIDHNAPSAVTRHIRLTVSWEMQRDAWKC